MSRNWYTIRVAGGLGATAVGAFPEFSCELDQSETTLSGELRDSAELYGTLARLEALGFELVDLHRVASATDEARTHTPTTQGGVPMSTIETQAVPTGSWSVDNVHSNVGFSIKYMAGTFTAPFSEFHAALRDGVLTGAVQVDSVEVRDPNLKGHLKSPEFFDALQYPEVRFESTSIHRDGDELTIDGQITIKGHTEPAQLTGTISDEITDPYGGTRFGLKLDTTIDRTAFGITWNNPLPGGKPALSNQVTLSADLQLSKEA
jgi:polyisoprenoid-binding protein YceI